MNNREKRMNLAVVFPASQVVKMAHENGAKTSAKPRVKREQKGVSFCHAKSVRKREKKETEKGALDVRRILSEAKRMVSPYVMVKSL